MMVGAMLTAATEVTAGGILTNTNQSIDFLRNPARDAAIGIDGVYSNPAGVAFLPEGLHLSFNWQYAHQTRTIESTSPFFALGRKNNGQTTKTFEGVADAPCIPSVQAAYNVGNWSWQFNFSVPGGGGSCEFSDGLGSFESVVGNIATSFMTLDGMATQLNGLTTQLAPLYGMLGQTAPAAIPNTGVKGYDMDGYMQGRQYYFGFQLGTAYKVNDHFSVYGGLRLLYGTATYKAKISNIMVGTQGGYVDFRDFLPQVPGQAAQNAAVAQQHLALLNQAEQAGVPMNEQLTQARTALTQGLQQLQQSQGQLATLSKYAEGVNLLCNQSSVGVAPIIGVDYKFGNFNFAAKYEFNTQMKMKNNSTLEKAMEIEAVNKFQDGTKVDEDAPALLAAGVQWTVAPGVNLNIGYHHYFDTDAHWYNHNEKLLDGGTNEYLAGAEWDITDKINISAGGQLTRYQLTDEYMNDMSFVVNSYSYGFGMTYKFNNTVKASIAYFQTNYEDYDRVSQADPTTGATIVGDSFTRSNRVLGLGVEITL